jgi:hypothetical protein
MLTIIAIQLAAEPLLKKPMTPRLQHKQQQKQHKLQQQQRWLMRQH